MAINQLNGLGSIRFYYGTLADWNASGIILSVNEIAIVTDVPGSYKQGQALPSMGSSNNPKTGPTFAQLPWFVPEGGTNPSNIIFSITNSITAHSGGGQTNAVLLAKDINFVTTVAAEGDSVKLPVAVPGMVITVENKGAEALAVFPNTGATINTLSANASVYISPGVSKSFKAQTTTAWQENAGPVAINRLGAAINVTGNISAAQLATGLITSTTAAAVSGTLPTATLFGAYLGAVQGTTFDVLFDNSAGANVFTVVLGSGMTQEGIGLLTVPVGESAMFRFVFTSTSALLVFRLGTDKAADVAALTDSSGGTSGGNTIAAVTDNASTANAVATLAAKVNAMRTALVNAGLMS